MARCVWILICFAETRIYRVLVENRVKDGSSFAIHILTMRLRRRSRNRLFGCYSKNLENRKWWVVEAFLTTVR